MVIFFSSCLHSESLPSSGSALLRQSLYTPPCFHALIHAEECLQKSNWTQRIAFTTLLVVHALAFVLKVADVDAPTTKYRINAHTAVACFCCGVYYACQLISRVFWYGARVVCNYSSIMWIESTRHRDGDGHIPWSVEILWTICLLPFSFLFFASVVVRVGANAESTYRKDIINRTTKSVLVQWSCFPLLLFFSRLYTISIVLSTESTAPSAMTLMACRRDAIRT